MQKKREMANTQKCDMAIVRDSLKVFKSSTIINYTQS